jgi:glycosyltransferase involved in cell wall biosynthesis
MENKIDILCTHDYRTLVAGCLARRGTKTGWVAFSRGWTEENFKVRLFHSIDKFIIRYADHVVAVSESQRERLLKLSVPEKKISVVHNAFDLGIIDSVTRIDLRQKFSLPSNAIVCLSAGRFSHEKGQQFLVEAANIAVKENGRLYFIMYGDGPELSRVREMAGKSEYHDHIICPGFEKYLLGCLKGADILVNPSLSEGLPNIVLEGMALGVPVVATAVGGVPELVRHLENGILVAPGESQSLAEGILTMAGKDVSIARITKAALSTVRDQYSFEKQMNELADVYRIFEEKKRY